MRVMIEVTEDRPPKLLADDLESREGASPMMPTFQRGGAELIVESWTREEKTGSGLLNGLAHGGNSMMLTGA